MALTPQSVSWGIQKAAINFRSPFAGSVESVEFPGQFWRISITVPQAKMRNGGQGEAFFSRLAGGAERVRVPYWPRLVPRGTMRGAPTLSAGAVRGDLQLLIVTAGTLAAGDMFGCGGQLFQAFQDCAAVAGVLTVPLVNRVRATIASGAAVTWDRPTVTCCAPSLSSSRIYDPGAAGPLAVDLEEIPS